MKDSNLTEIERCFIEEGYAVIGLNIKTRMLNAALESYERLIQRAEELGKQGEAKTRKSELVEMEGTGWSWGCDHIYSPLLREQTLLDFASLDPLPNIIHRLLGERVRFSGGHGHWSPRFYDYYLHWHRDARRERWQFGNKDVRCHVQVCIALTQEQVVHIVPGSHIRDLFTWEERYIATDRFGKHPNEIVPLVPAGHALIFNTYTLHRAQCAKENIRRSLHFGFTRVGVAPELGRLGKVFTWLGDEDFILMQSPFLRACIREQIIEQKHLIELGVRPS